MKTLSFACVISLLLGCGATIEQDRSESLRQQVAAEPNVAQRRASAHKLQAHMAFLADDALLGREPGTPGYDAAANYVAEQFRQLGLLPAGAQGSYFQNVQLRRSIRIADQLVLSATDQNGRPLALEREVDYAVPGSLRSQMDTVSAPVVFVGYGLVAPELDRDDYAEVDVRGKIVAVLSGTPSGIQSEERAFYGSRKAQEASSRGAIGMISLATPVSEGVYPFARLIAEGALDQARMGWLDVRGNVYSRAPNLRVSAVFSLSGSKKLFAQAPLAWEQLLEAAAEEGGVTPRFQLPIELRIRQASVFDQIESANVLGMIEGADAILKQEVLVLSAHLDHLGVNAKASDDQINNGALDNAAGVATMIEAARSLMAGPKPRRSILFFANTAEERGMLGAQYFAKNPTLDIARIVANINLDMPLLTYAFEDVIVYGGSRSTLRASIEAAAAQMSVTIGEDPFPEQGLFTRSDHFRFVEEGIPAVMLATGMANGGQAAWAEHFAKRYHRPSDDMNNSLDFDAAARFAELNTRIALMVANETQRPLWHHGDFFARQFNGPMLQQ
ncbi:MAG: M28 family metallopeptidase [Pseudomonadales bacterium]